MKKMYTVAIDSIFILALLAGCSPTASPSGNEGLTSDTRNYQVEIISLTEPVYETIRTENIDQPNCNGTGDVDNVVERTMGINHSIEVGLGLTVDVDGKLELFGTGVDLGAAISSELGYQYGVTESITRSITVRAAPKTHVVHTVKLSEVWESGTARVISNGESIDIPFRFRANFSIDLLESVPVDCSTGQSDTIQPAIQSTQVIIPQATISLPSLCPDYVNRSIVQNWNIGEANVPVVDAKVLEFNNYRTYPRGNFIEGDKIPAGVIVATSFDGANRSWNEFPVQPLVHRGNYGLFETLGEYIAPYEGACISIAP